MLPIIAVNTLATQHRKQWTPASLLGLEALYDSSFGVTLNGDFDIGTLGSLTPWLSTIYKVRIYGGELAPSVIRAIGASL